MPVRGLRRINLSEAEVVRRIFDAYAAGRSAHRIAHDLNAEGVPGPRGAEWGASTISGNAGRGNGILNNELYIGKHVWNHQRFIKDPDTGRRVPRHNAATAHVIKDVPELRIVPQEWWDRVKARQATMRCDVREINRVRGDENARRNRLRVELTQVERRLRRMVEAIADGVPARTLKDELLALELRQEQLEAELAAAPAAQQPLLHPNLAETYRRKVAALAEALADEAVRDDAFELIRSLLDKIVLVPEGEELRIDIHGELASILELCQQSKTPGRSRASAEQIKMIAGVRFGHWFTPSRCRW